VRRCHSPRRRFAVVEANTTTSGPRMTISGVTRCISSLYSPMSTTSQTLSLSEPVSLPERPNVSPLRRTPLELCSPQYLPRAFGLLGSNQLNPFVRLSLFFRPPSTCRGCIHHSCRVRLCVYAIMTGCECLSGKTVSLVVRVSAWPSTLSPR
jgi:hypothetical protein